MLRRNELVNAVKEILLNNGYIYNQQWISKEIVDTILRMQQATERSSQDH